MQMKSLGLIETAGLCAGVVAADTAVKSANVQLVGYEFARGGGWTTIKVLGDVGAVKAAIAAAAAAVSKMGTVVSTRVIARPAASLEYMIHNSQTVGYTPEPTGGAPNPSGGAPQAPDEKGPENSGEGADDPSEKQAQQSEDISVTPQPGAKQDPAVPSEPSIQPGENELPKSDPEIVQKADIHPEKKMNESKPELPQNEEKAASATPDEPSVHSGENKPLPQQPETAQETKSEPSAVNESPAPSEPSEPKAETPAAKRTPKKPAAKRRGRKKSS